ncbi:MAG: TonB family protein [Candidatus Zixiibacteriota bacterium]|nr:MAG: TonB family protein [candidate division Zixibacteria bacterium]
MSRPFKLAISPIAAIFLIIAAFEPAYEAAGDTSYPYPDDFVAVDINPEIIYQVTPEYPSDARDSGIEGSVRIKVLVDNDGSVVKVLVGESSGETALDRSALEAVENFRFKPALQGGKPVMVWVEIPVEFVLDDGISAKNNAVVLGVDDFVDVEVMAKMIHEVSPEYPIRAREKGKEGVVWIKALVNKDGSVGAARVISCSYENYGFREAALAAAKKTKYTPAIKDGSPVAIWITYKVDFRLH